MTNIGFYIWASTVFILLYVYFIYCKIMNRLWCHILEQNRKDKCIRETYVEFINYNRAVLQTLTDYPVQTLYPCCG